MVAPEPILENLVQEDFYLISPGWLARWEDRIAAWGFDLEWQKEFVADMLGKVCLMDTLVLPDSNDRLRALGTVLDLPTLRIPVGMSFFDSFADERFAEIDFPGPLPADKRIGPVSDYAMALDLLAQLNLFRTEAEVIQQLLSIFSMLFAPSELFFVRYADQRPVGVHRSFQEESSPGSDTVSACLSYADRTQIIGGDNGFVVPLDFMDQRMGLFFISHFAVPDRLDSYRNLMEAIVPICGLSLNNARTYEALLRNMELRDRLLSIVGHDLRGPMGSIAGLLKIFADDAKRSISGDSLAMLTEIIKAADDTFLLLQNLLEWAKSQTGTGGLRIEPHRLHDLAGRVLSVLQSQALTKKIILWNEVPPDLDVRTDADALQTILRNLVSNAMKFSHPGGIVRVRAAREGTLLRVEVIDHGVGMDTAALKEARNFAERRSTQGTQGERGTGLGLLLCRDLTERLGGTLEFQSAIGEGTRAILFLPL